MQRLRGGVPAPPRTLLRAPCDGCERQRGHTRRAWAESEVAQALVELERVALGLAKSETFQQLECIKCPEEMVVLVCEALKHNVPSA